MKRGKNLKRVICMVIDSMGIGAMPDCREFNDTEKCNTLRNVCEFNKGSWRMQQHFSAPDRT